MSSEITSTNVAYAEATETTATTNFYFIDTNQQHPTIKPSLRTDVIRLYGLNDISQALARNKPDGTKGVKLRKSYKNHISDLPGKHSIPTERTLSEVVFRPENPDLADPEMIPFAVDELKKLFDFEKTSMNGIPGFDTSRLAIDNMDAAAVVAKREKKRKQSTPVATPGEPEVKRRHVQVHFD